MKKIYALIFLILLFTGCSSVKEVEKDSIFAEKIAKEFESCNWEYLSPETTYEASYESDYWNYLDDQYEKMYYEAAVNADFTDNIQKGIYFFYGDEVDKYSYISVLKANEFARLDHPELELINMDFGTGSCSNRYQGYIYHSLTYYSREYDQYQSKLDEVNSEIKDLVDAVNNTEDIIEKHRLIFGWITSNVKYVESEEEVGNVNFYDDKFILARMNTASNQNIYGAIVKKEAICDGIADAYKYICNQCHLECITIIGYISDISKEMYHAWNLVKIYDNWYLIDATWNLGENYFDFFMVKDLNKGDRTPVNIGYNLPGYTDTTSKQIIFVDANEKRATTDNGLVFDLLDENYSIEAHNDTISTFYSSLGLERYMNKSQEVSDDISIQTNAEVTRIEYFDIEESLLKSVDGNGSTIVFPERVNGKYVDCMNVYLLFNGDTYKIKLEKSGL